MNRSLLARSYEFLSNRWNIPLDPGNYFDLLILLFMGGVSSLFAIWLGGMDAAAMAWGCRIFAAGLLLHLYVIWRRSKDGAGLRPLGLIFLPWVLWLGLGGLLISPKPWLTEAEMIGNLLVLGVFYISLHHLRHTWLSWILGGLLVAFVSIIASVALGDQHHIVRSFLGRTISPVYQGMFSSTLGHPAAMGAVLLLAFFPALAIALGNRWIFWQRLLALYFATILAIAIWSTHHLGVWVGLIIGTVLTALLVLPRLRSRLLLIAIVLALFAWQIPSLENNIGVLRHQPVPEQAATGEAVPAHPLLQTAFEAFSSAPIFGNGRGSFPVLFEQFRPAEWESTPEGPGSLLLAVLVENGLLGTLLLLGPAIWLWLAALSCCLRVPMFEKLEKDVPVVLSVHTKGKRRIHEFIRKRKRVSIERYFLGGLLAGTAGAAILLLIDYPGFIPAVACLFALQGAILLRFIRDKVTVLRISKKTVRFLLAPVTALIPVLWLLWVLAPLAAIHIVEETADTLQEVLPVFDDPEQGYRALLNDTDLPLLRAYEDIQRAVVLNPANGDAWHHLSLAALRLYTLRPDQARTFSHVALQAAEKACANDPADPQYRLARGAAALMCGDIPLATTDFRTAVAIAPRNLSALLLLSELLSQSEQTRREASDLLQTAEKLYPENSYVRQRHSLLQLGNSSPSPSAP